MNIVLRQNHPEGDFYITSIRRTQTGLWGVRSRMIRMNGELRGSGQELYYKNRKAAEKACRGRAKKKKKLKGYVESSINALPEDALIYLAPDPENVIDTPEMVALIKASKRERYVYFKEVIGVEDLFKIGLEYLAYITSDTDIMEVEADDGTRHNCMVSRFERVEFTERTQAALKGIPGLSS